MTKQIQTSQFQAQNDACVLAQTHEQREMVFRLRYACYRRKGSISASEEERFEDHYDSLPNSYSFLIQEAGEEPLATVRITVVRPDRSWTESPVTKVYGNHPAFSAIAGASYAEASRLCFHRQARRDTFIRLVGHMAALAEHHGVEWLVACPRVEHAKSYQRMFGFRPLAEPRKYFGVSFETQLLGIRLEELREYVREQDGMLAAWSDAMRRLPVAGMMLSAEQAAA